MPGFRLEAAEETLHDRVIPAIAPAAHAGCDAHGFEALLVGLAGVLAALVGVKEEIVDVGFYAPQNEGLIQRRQGERRIRSSGLGPADDLAGIQIQHHGKNHPAYPGTQVKVMSTTHT